MRRKLLLGLAGAAAANADPVPAPAAALTPAQIERGCTLDMIPWSPECHVVEDQTTTHRVGSTPGPDPDFDVGCDWNEGAPVPHHCYVKAGIFDPLGDLFPGFPTGRPPRITHSPLPTPGPSHTHTTTTTQTHHTTKTHWHTPPPTKPTVTVIAPTWTTIIVPTVTTTTTAMPTITTGPVPTITPGPVPTETTKTHTHHTTKTHHHHTTKTTVTVITPTQTTTAVPTVTTTTSPAPTSPVPTTTTSPVPTSPLPTTTTSPVPTSPAPTKKPEPTHTKPPKHPHPTSTTTPPTASPTNEPNNLTDVLRTLHHTQQDNTALKVGLGVGLGIGIPSAAAMGWVAKTLAMARGAPEIYSAISESLPYFSLDNLAQGSGSDGSFRTAPENPGNNPGGSSSDGSFRTAPENGGNRPGRSGSHDSSSSSGDQGNRPGSSDSHDSSNNHSGDQGNRPDRSSSDESSNNHSGDHGNRPDRSSSDKSSNNPSGDQGNRPDRSSSDESSNNHSGDHGNRPDRSSSDESSNNHSGDHGNRPDRSSSDKPSNNHSGDQGNRPGRLDSHDSSRSSSQDQENHQNDDNEGSSEDWEDVEDPTAGDHTIAEQTLDDAAHSVAESLESVRRQLRDQGLDSDEIEDLIQDFEEGLSESEWSASDESGASDVVEWAVNKAGGVSSAMNSIAVQKAAELASSGASAEEVADALLAAGVPAGNIASTSKAISDVINRLGGKAPASAARNAASEIISHSVTPQGVAISEAASVGLSDPYGFPDALRDVGVPEDAVDDTIEAVKDAIKAARDAGETGIKLKTAAIKAITQALPPNSYETSSGGLSGPNEALAQALLNVIGSSYNFWHVYPDALYSVLKKLKGKKHSKILKKILANGPPPATGAYRDITYPFQRKQIPGHNATSTTSSQPTSKSPSPTGNAPDKATDTSSSTAPAPTESDFCARLTDEEFHESAERHGKLVSDGLSRFRGEHTTRDDYLAYLRLNHWEVDRLLEAVPIAICSMHADPDSIKMTPPGTMGPEETLNMLQGLWGELLKIKPTVAKVDYCANLSQELRSMAATVLVFKDAYDMKAPNKAELIDVAQDDPIIFTKIRTQTVPHFLCGVQLKLDSPLLTDPAERAVYEYAEGIFLSWTRTLSEINAAGIGSEGLESAPADARAYLNNITEIAPFCESVDLPHVPRPTLPYGRTCIPGHGSQDTLPPQEQWEPTWAQDLVLDKALTAFLDHEREYLLYLVYHPYVHDTTLEVLRDFECRLQASLVQMELSTSASDFGKTYLSSVRRMINMLQNKEWFRYASDPTNTPPDAKLPKSTPPKAMNDLTEVPELTTKPHGPICNVFDDKKFESMSMDKKNKAFGDAEKARQTRVAHALEFFEHHRDQYLLYMKPRPDETAEAVKTLDDLECFWRGYLQRKKGLTPQAVGSPDRIHQMSEALRGIQKN